MRMQKKSRPMIRRQQNSNHFVNSMILARVQVQIETTQYLKILLIIEKICYHVSITRLRESEKAAITIPANPAPIPTIPIR